MLELSIIIPVYNAELYIEKCINSILQQNINNYEIIIINDGSTDNTIKILEKYEENEKIKIINQNNKGAGAARNTGLFISKGKYIMFLDGDDLLVKNNLKTILEKIKVEKLDILTFNCLLSKEGKILKNKRSISENIIYNGVEFLKNSLQEKESAPMPWINIYNKDFLSKNELFFNEKMKSEEDSEFYIRLILKVKKMIFLNIPVVIYRDTPNSLSKKRKLKKYNYVILLKTYSKEVVQIKDIKLRKLMYNYMSHIVKNIFFEELKFNNFDLIKENKRIYLDILKKSDDIKYKYFFRIILKIMSFFI